MADRQRLYVDMDGTLAVFKPVDEIETLYEKGYFLNLTPLDKVVEAVKIIINQHPEIEVHILSAYLSDSQYALEEKNQWLDKYLPEIDRQHRVFVPCGSDKKDFIQGGIRPDDYLLDDYTHNLTLWQPPAKGIKLLNGINHTRGTWENDRIRYDKQPDELAQNIVSIMNGKDRILDAVPDNERRNEIMEEYTYYSIHRPVSIGTFPKNSDFVGFENFDGRKYVEEIAHEAWGKLTYKQPLTDKQMHDYELLQSLKQDVPNLGTSEKPEKAIETQTPENVPNLGTNERQAENKGNASEGLRKEKKAYYDIDEIKAIPIDEVAEMYGIQLKQKGGSLWGKLREEKEESFKIYTATNTWYDFGLSKGGSNIQLVAEIANVSYDEAIQRLGEAFNIPPKNHVRQGWYPPTNRQYEKIGIQGDLATKNFDFDESLSFEQLSKISQKYSMSMGDLARQYPKVYHKVIGKIAIPYVYDLKQTYYKCLNDYAEVLKNNPTEFNLVYYGGRAKDAYNELKESYEILKKAIVGQTIQVYKLNADFDSDLERMKEGKISYEIGNVPYSEMKMLNGENHFIKVTKDEYENLRGAEFPYSAFKKGDEITLVVNQDFFRQSLTAIGRSFKVGNTPYSELSQQELYCHGLIDSMLGEQVTSEISAQRIPYNAVFKPTGVIIAVPKPYEAEVKRITNSREASLKHEEITMPERGLKM